MATVAELKQKLFEAERAESKEAWETWHKEGREFLDSIVGKCLMARYTNDCLVIFKVVSYRNQPVSGCSHPGYFELTTEGYFDVRLGSYRRPTIDVNGEQYGQFSFVLEESKKKKVHVPKLSMSAQSLAGAVSTSLIRIATYGKYKGAKADDSWACCAVKPEQSVRTEFGAIHMYMIDNAIYEEAKRIVDDVAERTLEFWTSHKEELEKLPRLNSLSL